MNRPRLIVGLAAVVAIVIVGYLLLFDRQSPSPVSVEIAQGDSGETAAAGDGANKAPATESAQPSAAVTAQPEARQESAPETGESEPQSTETAALQTPAVIPKSERGTPSATTDLVLPSFDVVRVEPSGEAVIAGRTSPRSVVTLYDGTVALGSVTSDSAGQWVLVLDTPLAPGTHELSLEAKAADGSILLSANVVVISVPQPRIAAASQPAKTQLAVTQPATQQPEAPAAVEVQQAATDQPATVQPAAPAVQGGAQSGTLAQERTASQVAAMPEGQPQPQPEAQTDRPLAVLMPRSGGGAIRILQQPESLNRGLGEGTLILETVDYDAAGHATIGGRAKPGARLVVYLDGKALGQIAAGAGGRWRITLNQPVSQGLHRIRVDQVDASGRVVARVETPFSRAAMVATLPDQTAVIVQPGNSLWRIARRIYGEGPRYSVIYQANKDQIREPDLIYPGQIFVVPVAN